jgi:hypothetical protein
MNGPKKLGTYDGRIITRDRKSTCSWENITVREATSLTCCKHSRLTNKSDQTKQFRSCYFVWLALNSSLHVGGVKHITQISVYGLKAFTMLRRKSRRSLMYKNIEDRSAVDLVKSTHNPIRQNLQSTSDQCVALNFDWIALSELSKLPLSLTSHYQHYAHFCGQIM